MGIPSLDLSNLKNVKDYKDWYGYSQKLENAIRLLREKTEALENDRDIRDLHVMKLEKEIETLQNQVKNYAHEFKILNEKYQETMQKNFKSNRNSNLEPMFKPIHSKTMSLVGMLKQYATGGGHASNEATERVFSPLKREKQPEFENERQTRRRSDGLTAEHQPAQLHLQMISDLGDNEDDSDRVLEMLGIKDINVLGPPELPKNYVDLSPPKEAASDLMLDSNYSVKPKPAVGQKMRVAVKAKPMGLKVGGLSLDIDKINKEHEEKERGKKDQEPLAK